MKILVLEHPRRPSREHFNDIANTPLWSCLMGGYAAAALEQAGFEALFWDHAVPGADFDATREMIQTQDPDLICVNAVYFWEQTHALFDFFDGLRRDGFEGHLNLFGFFPSLVYHRILSNARAVDSIAVGEFEHTLVDLARALDAGTSLSGIPGLALGETFAGMVPRSPEKQPDRFPFPKRASLEGTVTLLGSRGCYNHCSFCPVPSFYNQGPLWRGRSPENIAEEMQALADQGVGDFYFSDPNFIGPGRTGKQRTMALMDLIRPMGVTFGMETRPQDLDGPVMETLKAAGFTSLLMGIESGSSAALARLNKHAGAEEGARAIALCRAFGIEPEIGFLMFLPDNTLEDLRRNLAFLMENSLLDRLDRTANLLCHSQIVLAGTSGYQWYEKQGRLKDLGIFGFQAAVRFSDPHVAQVAKTVIPACHEVLREMGRPESPVFWDKPQGPEHDRMNRNLVSLFQALLERPGGR